MLMPRHRRGPATHGTKQGRARISVRAETPTRPVAVSRTRTGIEGEKLKVAGLDKVRCQPAVGVECLRVGPEAAFKDTR